MKEITAAPVRFINVSCSDASYDAAPRQTQKAGVFLRGEYENVQLFLLI